MQKAQLTSAQRSYSLVAGAVAHALFSVGWLMLGFVALGGGLTLLLGGTANGVSGLFGDVPVVADFIRNTSSVIGTVIIVIAIVALLLVALAAFASIFLLTRGAVRKPWQITFQSLGIVALLDVPLFVAYLTIAAQATDSAVGGAVFLGPVVGVVGSAVVGALVWWWMAWSRRGSASRFAGVTATASATAVAPQQKSSAAGDTGTTPSK
ncbi:hypothetical protein ESZ53_04660 [Salinibacterium sp. UTAS2018]|uniref:hypothetical protein n=1 Tax=Salinibacterium sp. UTAS2018 TaxID=2508880 RepID=UPI0010094521|nr:hypothetical protein [Salinibacterium sp. UTAS2018]QAV69785.1 hypothetical protein ESZ53_04660 [Salinibacterium sp. UTAS2018]